MQQIFFNKKLLYNKYINYLRKSNLFIMKLVDPEPWHEEVKTELILSDAKEVRQVYKAH
jgi:hypothetical protein